MDLEKFCSTHCEILEKIKKIAKEKGISEEYLKDILCEGCKAKLYHKYLLKEKEYKKHYTDDMFKRCIPTEYYFDY